MTTYVVNAFSVNMLTQFPALPLIRQVSLDDVRDAVVDGFVPAVGHADTAAIVDGLLRSSASTFARTTVALKGGDVVYVAQYRGPRLPEGTTTLPADASIVWYRVDVLPLGAVIGQIEAAAMQGVRPAWSDDEGVGAIVHALTRTQQGF